MDFASLRQQGIALLQRLAGETWTDHNTHDPGITILEQLCYALTDLGYRARYELPDLLTREGQDPYASLHGAARVLPTSPVTIADLRKVVIDVPGVKNAWIEPVDEPTATFDAAHAEVSHFAAGGAGAAAPSPNVSEVRVKGLYRVRIEKSDLVDRDGGAIAREVAVRLHRCRGLCQDFEEIKILDFQDVSLGATLEIDTAGDAVALLAHIYRSIEAYISPAVRFYSLGEMLARGRRVDEIFEGPLLERGFIDSDELARAGRRTSLRASDLIHELMAVPGVVAVKNLHFLADGKPKKWLLEIAADRTPRFDVRKSDIRLEKRGLRVDEGLRGTGHNLFVELAKKAARPLAAAPDAELRPPPGRDRGVGKYYSIQQQFPAVYGLGAGGLPESAPPARKAQAKQLKAYLMFYDQLLADHFAQLANVGKLFAFDDASTDSYFSGTVQDDGALGLDALHVSTGEPHRRLLQQLAEGATPGVRRRNRFLDHLLARFGEDFREYALLQPAADANDGMSREEGLARRKAAFLRDYPRIGRDRGTGLNYFALPRQETPDDDLSGLELMLRRKLGVSEIEERFYVVEHILLRPLAGDGYQRGPLLRAARVRDPYSLQISFVFPDWGRYEAPMFRQFVEQTVREHTPAHLTAYILWKGRSEMQAFGAAYETWVEKLRSQRRAQLGL